MAVLSQLECFSEFNDSLNPKSDSALQKALRLYLHFLIIYFIANLSLDNLFNILFFPHRIMQTCQKIGMFFIVRD